MGDNSEVNLRDVAERLGLREPGQRVLVVEDHIPLLLRLEEFWTEAGHAVTTLAGVEEIEDGVATGKRADLETWGTADLRAFDVVFMDHYFLSTHYNGARLTREIMLLSSPRIMGMSSDAAANRAICEAGALFALPKAELIQMLL